MKTFFRKSVPYDLATVRERLRSERGPTYWRSLEEVARTPEFTEFLHREFPAHASEWLQGFRRRDFLKLMGASLALAGLTSCTKQPIERIVPYVKQPEEIVPGKPLFFATAMTLGGFAAGLLVESHEGHPTKIEGNPDHPISRGATNVFHQASLLDLYDPDRSQAVLNGGEISSWEAFLSTLHSALQIQRAKRGAGLRILTETVTSPTLRSQIEAVRVAFPEARWHCFEPVCRDCVFEGARLAFGEVVETQYDFSKAKVILSVESDFLYSHPAALRYARDFADSRRLNPERHTMNRLYVVESTPTVTGTNADHRLPLSVRKIEEFTKAVAQQLGAVSTDSIEVSSSSYKTWVSAVVNDLKSNRGASIVIGGDQQPPVVHALVHAMNDALGNIGKTVHHTASVVANPANQLESLRDLVNELENDQVNLLVVLGGNPAFTAPADFEFSRHLARAGLTVHLAPDVNETSALCHWHIPQNHFLESWSDARAFDGTVSIIQPLILPLYAGKSAHDVVDTMLNLPSRGDYDIVRDYWKQQNQWPDFEKGWRRALHDGLIGDTALPSKPVRLRALTPAALRGSGSEEANALNPNSESLLTAAATGDGGETEQETYEIVFRADPNIWDGRFANNGWLQELAKPINKLTWDNAVLISGAVAEQLQLANGEIVGIVFNDRRLEIPVWIMPGQAERSLTLHSGYGRTKVGRVGAGTGFDVGVLRSSDAFWKGEGATLTRTGRRHSLAATQTHHVIDSEERQVFREGTFDHFLEDEQFVKRSTELPDKQTETLFNPEEHRYDGNHWGMSIDLTACIGCNACVLACQSENNIPVVGKAQVSAGREMQWIRIDTYFKGGLDNPDFRHQPVPCMQCENAPCELVCPVGATLHDKEGLNLQVYNRCIGTRYCSNNCPYKVRRFNFLQYSDYHTPSLKPMRNPDVTVRWRGVMEKCTYCIQRISAARIDAKKADRKIKDGEIQTACQQVCPAEAIVFGDIHDPNSRVSKLKALPLDYSMLGELNTRPRTTYLAKLRNPNPALESPEPIRGGES